MLDWRALVHLSDADLARLDIAAVNLACAQGLPGAERIDVAFCLRTLDAWAAKVRRYTDLAYQSFQANPAEYDHSEPIFRMVSLVLALRGHCGVCYDPCKIGAGPEDPFDFDEQFIHGVIQGPGGTCATLPVVYAAIGRRLSYPVKLVCTKRHLLCRWDDSATGVRFNIETCRSGVDSFPDEYYRTWPVPIDSPEEERAFGYLESFTPRRELANFVGQRAFRLADLRRYREAAETFILAGELEPHYARYPGCLIEVLKEWRQHLQSRIPPGFPPRLEVLMPLDRRRWPGIPWEVEREVALLHSTEFSLNLPVHVEHWWEPLRQGRPPLSPVPTAITVHYDNLLATGE